MCPARMWQSHQQQQNFDNSKTDMITNFMQATNIEKIKDKEDIHKA